MKDMNNRNPNLLLCPESKVRFEKFKHEFEDLLMKRHGITIGDCTDECQLLAEFLTSSTAVEFVEFLADKHDLDRIDEFPLV